MAEDNLLHGFEPLVKSALRVMHDTMQITPSMSRTQNDKQQVVYRIIAEHGFDASIDHFGVGGLRVNQQWICIFIFVPGLHRRVRDVFHITFLQPYLGVEVEYRPVYSRMGTITTRLSIPFLEVLTLLITRIIRHWEQRYIRT